MAIYAVGDIHGRFDALQKIHSDIMEDAVCNHYESQPHKIIFVGDYIDRGPESCEVIEFLMSEPFEGFEHIYLKGNHEALALGKDGFMWDMNGGYQTKDSYQKNGYNLIPGPHRDWMKKLKLFHKEPGYLFVHAGIDPLNPNDMDEEIVTWIRDIFLESNIDYGFTVVHGHSIIGLTDRRQGDDRPTNRINLDYGSFTSGKVGWVVIDGDKKPIVNVVDAGIDTDWMYDDD